MGTAPGIGDAPAGPPGGGYLPPVRTAGISASNVGQQVAEAFNQPTNGRTPALRENLVATPSAENDATRPATAPVTASLGEGDLSVPVLLLTGGPAAPAGQSSVRDGTYKLGDLLEAAPSAPVKVLDESDEFALDPAELLKSNSPPPLSPAALAAAAMGRMMGGRR